MVDRLPKISRRDFLKQMSLIAVGVGLAPLSEGVIEAAEDLASLADDVGCGQASDTYEPALGLDDAGPLGRLVLDGQEVGLWDLRISRHYEHEPLAFGYEFDLRVGRRMGRRTTQIEFGSVFPFWEDPQWFGRLATVEIYPIQTLYCFSGEAIMSPMSDQFFGPVDDGGLVYNLVYNLEVIGELEGKMV